MLSRNHRALYILLPLLLQCWITMPLSLAGDAPAGAEEAEVDEPPPAGYEERYYPLSDLCGELKDYSRLSDIPGVIINRDAPTPPRLNAEQIIQIIKVCAAPDSWGKHSPARISQSDSSLVVLQKPEVHDEVDKVMAWLHDGAMAPYHGTVVALKVKPELVAQLVQAPAALTPAELLKLIDEAGAESSPQIVDFNGFEGQCVIVSGTERRNYVHDFDVAGAVFDPVVRQLMAGLRLKTSGYRSPDCKTIRLDFEAELNRNLAMTSAHINTILTGLQDTPPAPPPANDKDEKKEKPPVIVPAQPPMRHVTQNRAQDLKLDLPSSSSATLCSALLLPQGKYGFVGTLDMGLTNNDGKTEVLAFFARATIGEESMPSLTGVSGLKQGEIFRLYPTQGMTRPLVDFPGQNVSGISMDSETAVCAPFAARPATSENAGLRKAKSLFQEQVRKDKLVEPVGPVIFTRLTEADHQKLMSALTSDYRRRYSPLRAHALAVAVPAEKGRKMILENARTFEYAAIQELANGAGAQVLMNESICVFNQQRMSSFAGIKSHVIWDYDINGDSYDPAIRSVLDRGYILDLQPNRCSDGKSLDVKINCQLVPSQGTHNRTILETNSVSSGATVNLVLTGNFDLDLPQMQVIDIHEQVKFTIGKYQLVGAAAVPGDGKGEARQTLLFVRMDNAGQ